MTRMAARGVLSVARNVRLTKVPDEPLGQDGGPRHADTIALGEADYTWPRIVHDAASGNISEAQDEVWEAWTRAYGPTATREAMRKIFDRPLSERAVVFFARLAFRGIYFPRVRRRHWLALLWRNRHVLLGLCYEAFHKPTPGLRRTPSKRAERSRKLT